MGLALLIVFVAFLAIALVMAGYGLGVVVGRWDRRRPYDAPPVVAPAPRQIHRPAPRRAPPPAPMPPPMPPPPMPYIQPMAPRSLPQAPPVLAIATPLPGAHFAPPPPPAPAARMARGSMPPLVARPSEPIEELDLPPEELEPFELPDPFELSDPTEPAVQLRQDGPRYSIVRSSRPRHG